MTYLNRRLRWACRLFRSSEKLTGTGGWTKSRSSDVGWLTKLCTSPDSCVVPSELSMTLALKPISAITATLAAMAVPAAGRNSRDETCRLGVDSARSEARRVGEGG